MKHIRKVLLFLSIGTILLLAGVFLWHTFTPQSTNNVPDAIVVSKDAENMASMSTEESEEAAAATEATVPDEVPEETEPTEPPFQEYDITLMAVGDNLIHMGVVKTGQQADGTYDYSFLFEGISSFLDTADIKIINQETILGGNERGFSGFPYFNSPTEIGDAIVNANFNVVLQASNHSADQGLDGLLSCVDYWDKQSNILMTGICADAEAAREIPILEIGDISFAILNYTYSPNMEVLPEELEGHLNLLCSYDSTTNRLDFTSLNPQVIADIEAAKNLADIVIVCPHWGTEYNTKPSTYQQRFATEMASAGADLIIGTHPHVVQPVEWVTAENGNSALCYYSLGNYVSTQKEGLCMLEGMAWVTFHVTENDIVIDDQHTGILPMVCHYTSGPVRIDSIYLLEEYTTEQAASHGIHSYGGVNLTLEDLQNWSNEILGDRVISKKEVLAP